jgi:hypothetical protein
MKHEHITARIDTDPRYDVERSSLREKRPAVNNVITRRRLNADQPDQNSEHNDRASHL